MAEINSTLPNELIVYIHPEICISEYLGTRAMLEEEGVIPKGMAFPDGFEKIGWQDNRFKYGLCRTRPEGAKGARRDFLRMDWWCLRFEPVERIDLQRRRIQRQKLELEKSIYDVSAQGVAAINKHCRQLSAARDDNTFRKFLASIPDLLPKPRGRKRSAIGS